MTRQEVIDEFILDVAHTIIQSVDIANVLQYIRDEDVRFTEDIQGKFKYYAKSEEGDYTVMNSAFVDYWKPEGCIELDTAEIETVLTGIKNALSEFKII